MFLFGVCPGFNRSRLPLPSAASDPVFYVNRYGPAGIVERLSHLLPDGVPRCLGDGRGHWAGGRPRRAGRVHNRRRTTGTPARPWRPPVLFHASQTIHIILRRTRGSPQRWWPRSRAGRRETVRALSRTTRPPRADAQKKGESAMSALVQSTPWWREPTRDQWYAWTAAWLGWTLEAFDF